MGPSLTVNGDTSGQSSRRPVMNLYPRRNPPHELTIIGRFPAKPKFGSDRNSANRRSGVRHRHDTRSGQLHRVLSGNSSGTGNGLLSLRSRRRRRPLPSANMSTRGLVQTGDDVLIAGFISAPAKAIQLSLCGNWAVTGRHGSRKSFAGSDIGILRCQRPRPHGVTITGRIHKRPSFNRGASPRRMTPNPRS